MDYVAILTVLLAVLLGGLWGRQRAQTPHLPEGPSPYEAEARWAETHRTTA